MYTSPSPRIMHSRWSPFPDDSRLTGGSVVSSILGVYGAIWGELAW
jgi:hypothetical protein